MFRKKMGKRLADGGLSDSINAFQANEVIHGFLGLLRRVKVQKARRLYQATDEMSRRRCFA